MGQGRGCPGLGLEATEERTVARQCRVQHLDRDLAPEGGVVSEEDLCRRAGAERGAQAVATAEDAPDLVGHARGCHLRPEATGGARAHWGIMGACEQSSWTRSRNSCAGASSGTRTT